MSLADKQFHRFGEFSVDVDQRVLLRSGRPVAITPKVFDTLLILVENSGRIVTKEDLMSRLWPDTFVEESNLAFNIQQLRKAFGDDARHPLFIETVARRGYRFIAEVAEAAGEGATNIGEPVADGTHVRPQQVTPAVRRVNGAHLAIAGVGVLAIVIGGWLASQRSAAQPTPAAPARAMLAVLPLKNLTGDPSQEYFSDGLTEELIAQLGSINPERFGLIARTSVMHYKDSQKPLTQVGQELGVQYVLEGSVRRDSANVRVTVQLIKVRDQTRLWTQQYDRELTSLLPLQREIARKVASQIELTLTPGDQAAATARGPVFPKTYEAYDLYLQGLYFWNKRTGESLTKAIDYFQQATVADPTYARAFAGLANSHALMAGSTGRSHTDFLPKARAAAMRALELDENLPEALTALALIVQNHDWDVQAAEKLFRQAISLNANYATAHHWYAEHLTWRGRFDEAFQEYERARHLDPLSLIIASDYGASLYFARDYDRAIERFRAVRKMDPNFGRANLISNAYVQKGLFADALADIEARRSASAEVWYLEELTYAYGRSGQQARALATREKLLELNQKQPVDPVAVAWTYISTGDHEKAFEWLEKAYLEHGNLITLKVEPKYDPLRSDPRFRDLLRRVGLDQ